MSDSLSVQPGNSFALFQLKNGDQLGRCTNFGSKYYLAVQEKNGAVCVSITKLNFLQRFFRWAFSAYAKTHTTTVSDILKEKNITVKGGTVATKIEEAISLRKFFDKPGERDDWPEGMHPTVLKSDSFKEVQQESSETAKPQLKEVSREAEHAIFQEKIGVINEQLAKLYRSVRIVDLPSEGTKQEQESKSRQKQELIDEVEKKNKAKAELVASAFPVKSDRVVHMASSGTIPKGMRFYHAIKSKEGLRSILSKGIRSTTSREVGSGHFGTNELGQGLYLSTEGGYAGEGFKYALIFETKEQVAATRVPYQSDLQKKSFFQSLELKEENEENKAAIIEGFSQLETTSDVIQRDGVPPRDQEVVLRNPDRKWKPVAYATWNEDTFTWEEHALSDLLDVSTVHQQWK